MWNYSNSKNRSEKETLMSWGSWAILKRGSRMVLFLLADSYERYWVHDIHVPQLQKRDIGRFELWPDIFGVHTSASSTVRIPAWRYRWRWSNCQRRLGAVETPVYNSLAVVLRQPRFPCMSAIHPASANSRTSWVWDFWIGAFHTSKAPVTATSIPPVSFEGCASKVETWCRTLENGSDWASHQICKWWTKRQAHRKFVDYSSDSLYSRRLERQHRCLALHIESQFIISSFLASYPLTYKAAKFCRLSSNVL